MDRIGTLLCAFALTLVACSGSGATVSDSSEMNEVNARPVEPVKPADPVDPTTSFECKTSAALSDGSISTIRFSLRGDALEPHIEIEPQSSVLVPLAKASLERKGGKLVLSATERAELTLFENSDFTRGYVKASDEYSDVYCTKR